MAAGWDEAVAELQRAENRKNAPGPGGQRRQMFRSSGGMNT